MEPHCEKEQIRALIIVSDRDFCKELKQFWLNYF